MYYFHLKMQSSSSGDNLPQINVSEIYTARNVNIPETRRKELVFTEIELLDKDIDLKSSTTRIKSNVYGKVNVLTIILILVCSGIIAVYQGLSDCKNIPVISLSCVIFVAQGVSKVFELGEKGYFYKQGTIRLRRLKRQARDMMYLFHTFTVEQVLSFVSQLRSEFDEIDLELYNVSLPKNVSYNTGGFAVNNEQPTLDRLPSNNTPREGSRTPLPDKQHLHIHIDNSTPPTTPRPVSKNNSAPASLKLNETTDIVIPIDQNL